jgi:hypothetical protein
MKWIINTPAKTGDVRIRKIFAWLPVRCNHWDKKVAMMSEYFVWLEYYSVAEEYRDEWVITSKEVIN